MDTLSNEIVTVGHGLGTFSCVGDSKATSAASLDISEKATLSASRSTSRLSARVFIWQRSWTETKDREAPTALMVSLAAISSWW